MLYTDIPARFVKAFASLATSTYRRPIPTTTGDPNAASLNLGFPPNTFVDEGAGGSPPDGRDFNGLLNQATAWNWWQAGGGPIFYDAAYSAANGGYAKYAVLTSTTLSYFWQSNVDNNTVDPDSGPSANWTRLAPAVSTSGGPGTGYRKSADGFIQQWGVVAIGAGVTSYSTSFSFPIPFTVEVNGPYGNASNIATPSGWAPVTVMFPNTTLYGSSVTADTANNSRAFQSGVYVRWTAQGY